jgi:transposase InsO family protein
MPRTVLRGSRLRAVELSPQAQTRLQALTVWQRSGQWQLAREVFGLSRASLYRWRQRYDRQDLTTLEARSRRPHHLRQPQTPAAVVERIHALRKHYPRWGREKLRVLLAREGVLVSGKTIDRVLARLRSRGVLVEPPRQKVWRRPRRRVRPYAVRKPRNYVPQRPGELVELDTLDVRPVPGLVLKQFTARDVVSRWDVFDVYTRATATTAARFLDQLEAQLPFPLRALQVDGGGEFAAVFEQECERRQISLFLLPPRSPKLNGHVERAQRTHTEEFYECYDGELEWAALRAALREWEHTYNHVRPHQALGYLTPAEFLANHLSRGPSSHMS